MLLTLTTKTRLKRITIIQDNYHANKTNDTFCGQNAKAKDFSKQQALSKTVSCADLCLCQISQ